MTKEDLDNTKLREDISSLLQGVDRSSGSSEWGIDITKVLSPISMPSEKVLRKALNLYQTNFRKPSLNVYCLDYSGSMKGKGNAQLDNAMNQILIQKNAEKYLLQAEKNEVNIVITFNQGVKSVYVADSAKEEDLEKLYKAVENEQVKGGTDIYTAIERGMKMIADSYNVEDYTPAIILMSDGESDIGNEDHFLSTYQMLNLGVPVFSIMFGEAKEDQLEKLAKLTNARVFDGRENLIAAFKNVKGYN